jgi:hypothetical protein
MPRSTVSSIASDTRWSTYATVRITCPPFFKYPSPSRASPVSYSLHKLKRNKRHTAPVSNSSSDIHTSWIFKPFHHFSFRYLFNDSVVWHYTDSFEWYEDR